MAGDMKTPLNEHGCVLSASSAICMFGTKGCGLQHSIPPAKEWMWQLPDSKKRAIEALVDALNIFQKELDFCNCQRRMKNGRFSDQCDRCIRMAGWIVAHGPMIP